MPRLENNRRRRAKSRVGLLCALANSSPGFLYDLLLSLIVLVMLGLFVLRTGETPGVISRCVPRDECVAELRRWYDFTWLCCEDGSNWPAVHILNPMGMALATGSPVLALLIPYQWEVLEAVLVMNFDSFLGVFESSSDQFENAAGAIVGDAFINGSIGVLLAIHIAKLTNWQGLFGAVMHQVTDARSMADLPQLALGRGTSAWVLVRYTALTLVTTAIYLCHRYRTVTDVELDAYYNWGSLIAAAAQCFYLGLVVPHFLYASDTGAFDIRVAYTRVRWWWIGIIVAVELGGVGPTWLVNGWYQTWVPAFVALAILRVLLFIRALNARR